MLRDITTVEKIGKDQELKSTYPDERQTAAPQERRERVRMARKGTTIKSYGIGFLKIRCLEHRKKEKSKEERRT